MKRNLKIGLFWRFLLRSEYAIQVKIWQWQKLLNSIPFIKKTLVNHFGIWIWAFCLTFTALQWLKTSFKISQFSRFLLRSEYTIQVKNLKMTKTSWFCSIHQDNTCQSCLHSNFIILTDFQSLTVNEEKLQN